MAGPDPHQLGNPRIRSREPAGGGAQRRGRPCDGGVDGARAPARREPGRRRGGPAHGDDRRRPGGAALDPRSDAGALSRLRARRSRVRGRACSGRPRRRDRRSRHDVLAGRGARGRDRRVFQRRHGGAGAGHRACDDPVHGHCRLERTGSGARRQSLGGSRPASPRGRPGAARPLPRPGAGHGRRRLLRGFRRPDPRHPLRSRDPERGGRSGTRREGRACTPASAR